ncbi:MAG: LacI family DNA-binding transcriptional regulator [Lachnospirales bacterium]
MSISAKELAKKLNISAAAVSMALNGKPGVSTETRKKIIEAAKSYSYDFTKIKPQQLNGSINFIVFKKHGTVVNDSPFFKVLFDSITEYCKDINCKLYINHLFDNGDVLKQLDAMISHDCKGIILLGTEMQSEDFFPLSYINFPIVLLDTYFNSTKMDCVLINNLESAYKATNTLIKKFQSQPGYLHSSYHIHNFEERADGYFKAIRSAGMSVSNSIVHKVAPSVEGTYADLKTLIEQGVNIARCYFADNDLIAIGAMKAFKEAGYKIPEDIAIIGFDDLPICSYFEPSITTINVPIKYMAQTAIDRLLSVCNSKKYNPIKIEVSTNIIFRSST